MKVWIVLLGSDAIMSWCFINGLLALLKHGKFEGLILWPAFLQSARTTPVTPLSARRKQLLGLSFAAASGVLLFCALLPATVGLMLKTLGH
jgi:hypothetical protein